MAQTGVRLGLSVPTIGAIEFLFSPELNLLCMYFSICQATLGLGIFSGMWGSVWGSPQRLQVPYVIPRPSVPRHMHSDYLTHV